MLQSQRTTSNMVLSAVCAFMMLFLAALPASAFVVVRPAPLPTTASNTNTATRLFFGPLGVDIASPEMVLQTLSSHKLEAVVILDVRSDDEIIKDGFIKTTKAKWLQVNCTPMDCPLLKVAAENMIPDKTTPIVLHCASGMRAKKAQEILKNQGYTTVVNAGGFKNLAYLQQAVTEAEAAE